MADKLKDVVANIKKALHDSERAKNGELPVDTDSATQEINVEKLKEFVNGFKQQMAQAATRPGINIHWAVFLAAFIILFSFLGLFAYRLVQSLQEKERKREEKRKLKELKKKK